MPPPLIYVGGFVIGWAIGKLVPMPALPHRVGWPLAFIFLAAFIVTWAGALPLFVRAKTPISPAQPATRLITSGIFSLTRNPLYLGWIFLYLAVAAFMSAWWAIVLLVPAAVIVDRLVVSKEERYLERRFGDEYRSYKQRVRRWL